MAGAFDQTASIAVAPANRFHNVTNVVPDSAASVNMVGYGAYIATASGNTHTQVLLKGADFVAEHDGSGDILFIGGVDCDAEFYGSGIAGQVIGIRALAQNEADGTATELVACKAVWGSYGSVLSGVPVAAAFLAEEAGGGGPIALNYGLILPTLTQGTTNIAIQVGANPSMFGGSITATAFLIAAVPVQQDAETLAWMGL